MSFRNLVCSTILGLACVPAQGTTVYATYLFQNSLSAQEPGRANLLSADPLGQNGFLSASVQGTTRTVFAMNGANSPTSSQGGLIVPASLDLIGISYSVEMVVLLSQRDGQWRRLLDVETRQSDNGFYVSPSNLLYIYPITQSTGSTWTNNVFHHVVLTVGNGNIRAYLDGALRLTVASNIMDLQSGTPLMVLLDNIVAGGQFEWSPGQIALLRLYDGPLSDQDVATLASNPFGSPPACPADFNADGSLDPDDLGDYITCFFSTPPCTGADFNVDGDVNPDDLGDYITAYFTGCP